MSFDHDKFLPPVIKLSTSPYCTNISSPYNGTNTTTTTMHNTALSATLPKAQHFPLPCKSQCTHLSTVNVHSARPIDSAHFAQPMSHNSTHTCPSLVHLRNNRPADSTCMVSYISRQYARTVPNVDMGGSSECCTRHLATEGVACFNYVLVTNSNPVMTSCEPEGQVNLYPNITTTGASTVILIVDPTSGVKTNSNWHAYK
jgi:hypothetical protein